MRRRRPRVEPSRGRAERTRRPPRGPKTRQAEREAKEAERERDRQRRKGKGPLGGLGDTLLGR
jgi:hypothetical protein